MTPIEWLKSGDTGISSITILYVMTGTIASPTECKGSIDIPYDADDFGRCYRLLQKFPEWRQRISEVATMLPKWTPIVERWGEMELLYNMQQKTALTYLLMDIYPECLIADGWQPVDEAKSCWRRVDKKKDTEE